MKMRIRLWMVFCWLALGFVSVKAQNSSSLWDDARVSSIFITIPTDSLDSIFTNIYSDHYFPAEMVFDDGQMRDTVQQVGFRLRGNSSRNAFKKSFKISFNEFFSGRRYQAVKKLNLNASHNDPTMVREKLFYEVWNQAGMPARRTTFVQLFINGTLYGLYNCQEEFDKDWLNVVFSDNDGNLYKCTYPSDLVYLGTNQQAYKNIQGGGVTGGRAYDLKTNEALDDYSGLVTLIVQLNRNPDAQFQAEINQYVNVEGYLKALAIDVATGNWDDYAYNKNNFFLYQRFDNAQFQFVTYDADNTFGVDWVQRDWATRDCNDWLSHSGARPLASKLLDVPDFRLRYNQILDSITRHITNPDSIFPRIDFLQSFLAPYAAADTFRSLDYGYTLSDFALGFSGTVDGHTPYGIKPFLQTRYNNTLSQLLSVQINPQQDISGTFSLYPNPVAAGQLLNIQRASAFSGEVKVAVMDMYGRVLLQESWPGNQGTMQLNVADFAAGKYFLRIQGEGISKAIGFVKW